MAIKIQNELLCEYCFHPLRRREVCACGGERQDGGRHPSVLPLGAELDRRYVVGRVLGKGGFGVTYLCYDRLLRRRVAIKEYMPRDIAYRDASGPRVSAFGPEQQEAFSRGARRFSEEAETVRLFNGNPNIISVFELFQENGTAYYVMEYLEGRDIRNYMKDEGQLSESQTVYMATQISNALTIVHSRKILHRDISPDNIFICGNGSIKLIDFGAAKQVSGSESQLLSMVLKQGFAPVEQYQTQGAGQGPWTDIYALGATMYYCISGALPPDAMTRLSGGGLDLGGFSPGMRALLEKAMAPAAAERFQSSYEMLAALERLPSAPLTGDGGAHRHSFTELVTPPGCATQGFTTHVCACGEAYVDGYTPPAGHRWEPAGDGSRRCAVCGAREREDSAHVHRYNAVLTSPTCTERGYTTHICACGALYRDLYTAPLGHLWSEWRTARKVTENMEGLRERICRRCGQSQTELVTTYRPTGPVKTTSRPAQSARDENYEDFT